jgi:metal-dependent amidase/aminoacylase/carboxypeptidase family protein
MDEAVQNVIGEAIKIRQDRDIHAHGELWIEEKGEKYYKMLDKYLEPMEDKKDQLEKLKRSIFTHPEAV